MAASSAGSVSAWHGVWRNGGGINGVRINEIK
jgi:hypothetical protein